METTEIFLMTFKLLLGSELNSLKLKGEVASLNCNLEQLYIAHDFNVSR